MLQGSEGRDSLVWVKCQHLLREQAKVRKPWGKSLLPTSTVPGEGYFLHHSLWVIIHSVMKTAAYLPNRSHKLVVWALVCYLLRFPPQPHPTPRPNTSSSCAPDSSISGTTDCTGRGPLGEKAPRGKDTSRGQSSSGGSPIRL